MVTRNSLRGGDVILVGKRKKMFARRQFFRKLRGKVHEKMRESLRVRVLSMPRISLQTLRWFIISQNRLTPISELCLLNTKPARVRRSMTVEEAEIEAYPNEAKFAFNGSAVLLEASPSDYPNYFGEGEIGIGWFVRVYPQDDNQRDLIVQRAEYDLFMMRYYLSGQVEAIAAYNAWLERAVDRAIIYYADHITLWRQEGEVDEARFNANMRPAQKSAAAAPVGKAA